jgi:hypothetical protein
MKEQNRVCRKLFSRLEEGKLVGHTAGFTIEITQSRARTRWLESSNNGTIFYRPVTAKSTSAIHRNNIT